LQSSWIVRVLILGVRRSPDAPSGLELEDSISGSASDSDSANSDVSDAVGNLLQRAKISSRPASPSDMNPIAPQTPLAWFHSPPATQIGVYKALFSIKSDPTSFIEELKSLQTSGGPDGRKWAMFMTAGGHFAGIIVRVSKPEIEEEISKTAKQKRLKRPRPDTEVLLHKTFHRYTSTNSHLRCLVSHI
jgi:Bacteroidetes VLRF1 release factor